MTSARASPTASTLTSRSSSATWRRLCDRTVSSRRATPAGFQSFAATSIGRIIDDLSDRGSRLNQSSSSPPTHSPPTHTNRLARETSPYLLQHQHNPVDWYAWGDEAFAAARSQDKPIFLSVGYSTCYWCHVMERHSFENDAIAAEMNRLF